MNPPPIPLEFLRAGQQLQVGWGVATVLPDLDFELYSEAGFELDESGEKWLPPTGAKSKGLGVVGVGLYAEHPTTDVLSLYYDLKQGKGPTLWVPGMAPPHDLLEHLAKFNPLDRPSYKQPGLIEAHNSGFEVRVFIHVMRKKYGWPVIDFRQFRCSMAKARAFSLPGGLDKLCKVLGSTPKNPEGDKLIKKYSVPQNLTKSRRTHRLYLKDNPADEQAMYGYNRDDIIAEADASRRIPDLIPMELDYWLADQACNLRGIGIDRPSVMACISVLEQAHKKYNAELFELTGGEVARASEVQKLIDWVARETGKRLPALDTEAVEKALNDFQQSGMHLMYPHVMRALEIRGLIGSASVKKVYAMARMATSSDRIQDLHNYHGARTGRDTHSDVQPGNLPKKGPKLSWCEDVNCQKPYAKGLSNCPWCGASSAFSSGKPPGHPKADAHEWHYSAVDFALEVMRYKSLELVEYFFGDAVLTIGGSVRGLIQSADGYELICSDFSSIEAVGLAMLAGEEWRIEAFRKGESIYYHGAAGVTGKSYQWYMDYEKEHGRHPDRNKIGKIAELALGYMGGVRAWRNFDKTDTYTDKEVKAIIQKWRAASPALVELAGGQTRGLPWAPDSYELYGYEGMFVAAILNPGQVFSYRGIDFQVIDDILYVKLLSGRRLTYHQPRATPHQRFEGVTTYALSYMTWNSNPAMGPMGWTRMDTYAGRLVENITQAVCRDLMSAAVVRLERAQYPVVMRVHDEIVSEVPKGWGSVEEFERIMQEAPDWARDWPIKAAGGWRGRRYRKD